MYPETNDPSLGLGISDLRAIRFRTVDRDQWTGERKSAGLIRLERDALVIEVERKPNGLQKLVALFDERLVDQGPSQTRVPLDAVERFELERKWWKPTTLVLQVSKLGLLQGMPGTVAGLMKVRIDKADVKDAEALISRALLLRSEQRLGA